MPMSKHCCLLFMLLLAGAGCDSGPNARMLDADSAAPPITADRFCAELTALVCAVNTACCGGVVAGANESGEDETGEGEAGETETCEEQQLAACEATVGALVEDPRTGYDPERAAAYLARLEGQAADCFLAAAPQLGELLEVFGGTGTEGADCTPPSAEDHDVRLSELSCADGLTCDLALRSDRRVRGECRPVDPGGCSHPHACGPGQWCDLPADWTPGHGYGDCKPLKVDAWGCTRDEQCQSQHCDPLTRTCQRPTEGRYCIATSYPATVLAHAPIAYWRLGDADGLQAASYLDEALDGAYVGRPGTVEGALAMDGDRAMALDGVDDGAELPALKSRLSGRAMSVELWFRRSAESAVGPLVEFRHEEEQRGVTVWNFTTPDRAQFNAVDVDGEDHTSRTPEATIEPDTWYHLVGTYDGSVVQLYVNGEPLGEPHAASFQPRVDGKVRIGMRVGDERRVTGAIDEVAVYDRALTPAQIRQHYQRGTEGPLATRFLLFRWLD